MKIVFWLPFMDHLSSHTWLSVQSLLKEKPLIVLHSAENLGRRRHGWSAVPLEEFRMTMLERRGWSKQGHQIIRDNPDAIHVFWSFWGPMQYLWLILDGLSRGTKVAVINEAYSIAPVGYFRDDGGIKPLLKVWLRPILYRFYAMSLGLFTRALPACILPLSLIARDQFLQAGFEGDSQFPFGYFVPRVELQAKGERNSSSSLRLVFVGALIRRKGLDIAIEAVEMLHNRGIPIALDVYGYGKPEDFIPKDSACIHYGGILKSNDVQSVISQYDALILPSRHDGWGVVVNEALLQGVPVIASDRVGAKCILEATQAGLVFKSEDINDLVDKLEFLCADPGGLKDLQAKAAEAGNHVLPQAAAQYMVDVLNYHFNSNNSGQRPEAIWTGRTAHEPARPS